MYSKFSIWTGSPQIAFLSCVGNWARKFLGLFCEFPVSIRPNYGIICFFIVVKHLKRKCYDDNIFITVNYSKFSLKCRGVRLLGFELRERQCIGLTSNPTNSLTIYFRDFVRCRYFWASSLTLCHGHNVNFK